MGDRADRGVFMRAALVRAAVAAAAGAGGAAAPAAGQIDRPEAAQRIVRVFDFEERDVNFERVPMHWRRIVHNEQTGEWAGFPPWNKAGFDDAQRVSGEWSVRAPVAGGSTALVLDDGVVPAIPGAEYVVTAKVRTEGFTHARARLSARVLRMANGRPTPIQGGVAHSAAVVSNEQWVDVSLRVTADSPEAAWLEISLEALQPAAARGREARPFEVASEDFSGAAWFDDVTVHLVPRVTLVTGASSGVFVGGDAPSLVAEVKDFTGESLTARISVRDHAGREVDSTIEDGLTGARHVEWRPRLERYGWHEASLEVTGPEGRLAVRTTPLVWAPPRSRAVGQHASRFAVALGGDPPADIGPTLDALGHIGAGGVQMPVEWLRAESTAELGRRCLDALLDSGRETTLVLTVPATATVSPGEGIIEALFGDEQEFISAYDHVAARFGQRVRRWQIGPSGDDFAFWRNNLAADEALARSLLARLAPEPIAVLPWPATSALPRDLPERTGLTLSIPYWVNHLGVADLAGDAPTVRDVTVLIEPPPASLFGRRSALETVKRLVQAWRMAPSRLAIRQPWTAAHQGGETTLAPTPELAAFRQVVERLAGRRIVADLPIAAGVTAIVLEGSDSDAIIAWSDFALPADAVLSAYLAEGPVTVIDLFGHPTETPLVDGRHTIPLGESPVFIEGVDVNLAQFRAGFELDPAFVVSTAERHNLDLVLTNPWPVTITGRLRIVEPEHWRISPRVHAFTIEAGKTRRLRFEAAFSVGEEAGRSPMIVDVDLTADKRYPTLRLTPEVEIGLPYVAMSASHRVEANGDVVVTIIVTNTGERPLTMQAFGHAPGFAREQAPISNLGPSQTTVKRFVFRGGAEALKGQSIRLGLIESDGLGRLNKTLMVE